VFVMARLPQRNKIESGIKAGLSVTGENIPSHPQKRLTTRFNPCLLYAHDTFHCYNESSRVSDHGDVIRPGRSARR
jgi:hypothetical protein